jgi:hypothetical protein
LCLSLVALAGSAASARAQGAGDAAFLTQAYTRVTNLANNARNLVGYGYRDGISILAGWANTGNALEFDVPLRANTPYAFLASGDNDAQVVDLEILDWQGMVVANDPTQPQRDAIVFFNPAVSGKYTMRMTLRQARLNLPCVCAAVILKQGGGWNVPLRNLGNASAKIVRALATQDRLAGPARRVYLRRAANEWTLFGAILPQGSSASVRGLNLGNGQRIFHAAGDSNTQDVDLFLERGGMTVARDDGPAPEATIFHLPGRGPHGLRMLNYQGGTAVTLMAVFEER